MLRIASEGVRKIKEMAAFLGLVGKLVLFENAWEQVCK